MDFICACTLLFLWFVRPQDIFAVISGVSVVKYLMYAGIFATFRRSAGLTAAKVWATPMDWLVSAYCLWAIYATEAHTDAAKEVFTYFSFHMVTALALSSWKRIETYINCWLGCLGILALLAVSTHWGFEIVAGSAELTAIFHDRLTLNTWVFRNPNALGHGVMTLIPAGVAWFLMAGAKNRGLGVLVLALAIHCVLLTESKGAFLACAGGLTMLFLFKRPVWLQLILLLAVYVVGLAALKSLPRMDTLSKSDEGIQGRMIVWQQAKASMEATGTGEGLKAFHGYVAVRIAKLHRTINIPIATHGSYVRHGADLGYMGLTLFAGIFYAGGRLLLQARTAPEEDARRVHRTLYALVITTAVSCWVVDRAYHMDYFLLTGLLSAFHRRFKNPDVTSENAESEVPVTGASTPALPLTSEAAKAPPKAATSPGTLDAAATAQKAAPGGSREAQAAEAQKHDDEDKADEHGAIKLKWDRLGIFDLVMMYLLLEIVLYYWDLFSTDFIVF